MINNKKNFPSFFAFLCRRRIFSFSRQSSTWPIFRCNSYLYIIKFPSTFSPRVPLVVEPVIIRLLDIPQKDENTPPHFLVERIQGKNVSKRRRLCNVYFIMWRNKPEAKIFVAISMTQQQLNRWRKIYK